MLSCYECSLDVSLAGQHCETLHLKRKKWGKDSLDRNAGGLTLNSSVLILFFCFCLFLFWAVAALREVNITANEALRRTLYIKII